MLLLLLSGAVVRYYETKRKTSSQKKKKRTLDVCRLKYLKTSRVHKYSNMNTFHTSQQSCVPVEHHRIFDVLTGIS